MPDAGSELAARCAEVAPGFVAAGSVRRARKSELLPGTIEGAPVIAKRLLRPNAVWDWYFAREVAIYRAFAAAPPPFAVPRVHAVADDVIVIERFPAALASLRRPSAALPAATVDDLLAMHAAIAGYELPQLPLPPKIKPQLERRLLEDPTDVAWIRDGLLRCHARGLIDDDTRDAARAALVDAPIAAGHGDMLLRNAMQRADGTVVLVDWECAGRHVADWDLALLWTQLAPASRPAVDAVIEDRRAFDALIAFALCRELVFLDAFRTPDDHRGRRHVLAELAAAAIRIAG